MNDAAIVSCGADYSVDRRYRYSLWRRWEQESPYALFIGLNPSTADESRDDPTIRRCRRFALDWGFGALYMANLFALRATDPRVMTSDHEPIGDENDQWLKALTQNAGIIICAWGVHGTHRARNQEVLAMLEAHPLQCLGTTQHGHPRHPLYVKASTQPTGFEYRN